jgi:3-hydroxy-9,10-secoandrosta-1,3,5(10)-triene-9,17-dione monooxygenase reductase component
MGEDLALDEAALRTVLGHFCTGITIITAIDDGIPVGLTAQSFTSLSLDPPLVLFCPAKSSSSWPRIRKAGHFCANVLGADQEHLCRQFALSGADKFAGVGFHLGESGAPVLDGTLAHIDCRIETVHDGGDHDIAVGRVLGLGTGTEAGPLLFYRGGYGTFSA